MNIIHKDCDISLSKDKSLPLDSYLITYLSKNEIKYDIVQSSSKVEIFDYYHDNYGGENIKSIIWTSGTVNPKLYGYKSKTEKKKK
jgi:hypothetical protein